MPKNLGDVTRREFLRKIGGAYAIGLGLNIPLSFAVTSLPDESEDLQYSRTNLMKVMSSQENINQLEEILKSYYEKYDELSGAGEGRIIKQEEVEQIVSEISEVVSSVLGYKIDAVINPQGGDENISNPERYLFQIMAPLFSLLYHLMAITAGRYEISNKTTTKESVVFSAIAGFSLPTGIMGPFVWERYLDNYYQNQAEFRSLRYINVPGVIRIGDRFWTEAGFYNAYSHELTHDIIRRKGLVGKIGLSLNEGVARCAQEESMTYLSKVKSNLGPLRMAYSHILNDLFPLFDYLLWQNQRNHPQWLQKRLDVRHSHTNYQNTTPGELDPHLVGTTLLKLLQARHGRNVYKHILNGDLSQVNNFVSNSNM